MIILVGMSGGAASRGSCLVSSAMASSRRASSTICWPLAGERFSSASQSQTAWHPWVDGVASGDPVALSRGVAQFQTSFSVAGAHNVTAAYSGDANNLSSSSGVFAITVPFTSGSLPATYAVTITATSTLTACISNQC
jgi:hypothetical protein